MILPRLTLWAAVTSGTILLGSPTIAQIVPDQSLSSFSVVTEQGNRSVITGGTASGNHLFHSFSQFSVPMNGSAYFNNPLQTQNIFTRVTGGIPSSIEGLIRANGIANVFLLNPSGILIGPNAQLAVGGSFTASTSTRMIFPDGKTFSAVDPQASPLLTINLPIGLQLGQPLSGSSIESQAVLTVPQNLTLQADRLTLSGQLTAGQNLTLQASDSLQIRDRTTQPFLAQSGGSLNLQGKTIDIFALNHPQSKISAQQNLTLRSPNPVIGDAHFSSGGNFRVEQLNGTLGKLVSPNGPVIRSAGDVSFAEYQGASLHIFAGGSVMIPGTIRIEAIDAMNGIIETVNLSDGTELSINGRREPTLDIRAGIKPEAIGIPTTATPNPIFANIQTGTISFAETPAPRVGTVLLTNQYEPNLALSGGDIRIERIFGSGAFVNGATIAIDARGTVKSDDLLLASSVFVNGGDIRILAQKDVQIPFIDTSSSQYNGGNVTIAAGGTINLERGILSYSRSPDPWNGGAVQITANGTIESGRIGTFSHFGSAGAVKITSSQGAIDLRNGIIRSEVVNLGGLNGSAVSLSAKDDILIRHIKTSGGVLGQSGPIEIVSQNGHIVIHDGGLSSLTLGTGNAGAIRLKAGKNVVINHSDILSPTLWEYGGSGNDITIEAEDSIYLDRTSIVSSSGIEKIALSNNYALEDYIFFQDSSLYPSNSTAGSIRLKAGQNVIGADSSLFGNAIYYGQGNAGKIEVSAGNAVTWTQNFQRFDYPGLNAFSRGQGNAGDISISATSLSLLGATVETGLSYLAKGQSGNININVKDNVLLDGNGWVAQITAPIRPSGFPVEAIGSKGNINIKAGSLTLRNGAEISTAVGDINQNTIVGGTATGNAGTIDLQIREDLSLSQSFISSRVFENGTGNAGAIHIQARSIEGQQSIIISDTAGKGNANTIRLATTENIRLDDSDISSAVKPTGIGDGKDITIQARSIDLMNGAQINTLSANDGKAGNVFLTADELKISGTNLIPTPTNFLYARQLGLTGPNLFAFTTAPDFVDGLTSGIFSSTNSDNKGGNITLNPRSLTVTSGGQIDARTTNIGHGGTLQITSDTVQLLEGGQMSAITSSSGNGGIITLNSNQIQISGSDPTFFNRLTQFGSTLDIYGKARVSHQGPNSGLFASTGAGSTGAGGSISIVTRDLTLAQKAVISVDSQGLGNGGKIEVVSDRVALDQGNLVAKTASGEGGNLFLTIQNLLTLRNNSQVSATANGTGNGGNIEVNVPNGFIIARPNENSDITANANQGRGGNISITAQSIFGIVSRSRSTDLSDITASSEVGINGNIRLTTLEPEPKPNLQALPQLIDSTNQIAQTCSARTRSNTLVVTGKGGLPPDPNEALNATQPWQSTASLKASVKSAPPKTPIDAQSMTEATHWIRDADGRVRLLAGIPVQSSSLLSMTNNCATIDRTRTQQGESS